MMRRTIVAAVVVVLCFARVASAQNTGEISGTVTATSDGSPIQFATVSVYDATKTFVRSGSTDASGAYSVPSLSAGTYYVRISKSGFVPLAYAGIPCASQACSPTTGLQLGITPTPVVVAAGATATVNVSLDRGGTISGTVRRAADGTPVSVYVFLYDTTTSMVAGQLTAGDGTYTLTSLPFGTYYARTIRSAVPTTNFLDVLYGGTVCPSRNPAFGFMTTASCRVETGTPIVVSSGAPLAIADFSVPPAGTITGHVTSAVSGAAASNVEVDTYEGDTLVSTTVTDTSGAYSVTGLDPGTYFVRTVTTSTFVDQWYRSACVACSGAKPQPVAVPAGATASGIDFALDSSTAGISGSVTLASIPAPQFPPVSPDIQIYNSDGTLVRSVSGVSTGPWGVTGLPPGSYFLRTSSVSMPPSAGGGNHGGSGQWVDHLYGGKNCIAADCDVRQGTPVTVTANTVTSGVNFTLEFGAQIGGNSRGASVDVYDARGVRLPQRVGSPLNPPFGSPFYEVSGLPSGTYYLVARRTLSAPAALYAGMPCDGCAVTSGTPVTVVAGGSGTYLVDFLQAPTGATISGTVRSDRTANPPNQPLAEISVEAYGVNGQLLLTTRSLADGTYSLTQMGAGVHYLRTRNARGYVDQIYGGQTCGACDPASGTAVVLSGTDVSGIDFALPQGQTLSGTVFAAAGGPLANVGVTAYASSPAAPAVHVTTDSSGAYVATVPPGAYFVQTDPVAGYAQQIYNDIACPQGVCPTGAATTVSVASSPVANINFNLASCSAVSIAPVSLANAAVGIAYRQTLLATGANGGRHFLVSSVTLPPGVSLDASSGVLSGTPTTSGQFTFVVSAIDSTGCAGSRSYVLDVPACVVNSSLPGLRQVIPAVGGGFVVPFTSTCSSPTLTPNVPWITSVTVGPTGFAFYTATQNTGGTRQGSFSVGSVVFTVIQSGITDLPPFGSLDAPGDGAVVSGSVAISGWSLDDHYVNAVTVWRDPVTGEPPQPVFIGNATFVSGARPDVAAAYPTLPLNDRAGWGYLLLTNMLPNQGNGTFRISVYAEDIQVGAGVPSTSQRTLLGTRIITAINGSAKAPFGAIDTPAQGGSAAGSAFVNFGWALTPQPNLIPFDGSTIHVLIDGVDVGPVSAYNFFRSDVSTLFPGLQNSPGPVGYRIIDTTALSEGLHTIAWLATDDGGMTTGIGSRYFSVQNSAWQPSLRANFMAAPPAFSDAELAQVDSMTAVPPRVDGIHLGRNAASLGALPPADDRTRVVTMSSLQSLELSLRDRTSVPGRAVSASQRVSPETCAATYAGYLVVNGELRPLPVGSSLDPTGTFYWHPGPGFFGTYELLFVRTSCDGVQRRIEVVVNIHS